MIVNRITEESGAVNKEYEIRKALGEADPYLTDRFNAIAASFDQSEPEERPLTKQQASLADKLEACRFDADNPPKAPKPIYLIGDVPICAPGNLTVISGHDKSCKTTFTNAFLAASTGLAGDTLGVTSKNPHGFAVLHFDTEQSPDDHFANVLTAFARIKLSHSPQWVRSYCVTAYSPAERLQMFAFALDQAQREYGGIHSILLDGPADLIEDVNDKKSSKNLVMRCTQLPLNTTPPVFVSCTSTLETA